MNIKQGGYLKVVNTWVINHAPKFIIYK